MTAPALDPTPAGGSRAVYPGTAAVAGDPAPLGRVYPTTYPTTSPPAVPPGVDVAQFLPAAGYPDHAEAAQAFAAGQRRAARETANRAQLDATPPPGPYPYEPAPAGYQPPPAN